MPDLIVIDQSLAVGLLLGNSFNSIRLPQSSSFTDEYELFLIIPPGLGVCEWHGLDVGRLSEVETVRPLLVCSARDSCAGSKAGVPGDERRRLVSL